MADELVQDWDDEAEYHAAVGRSWLVIVVALVCVGVVIGVALVGVFGVFGASEVLSIISG
ncbi:hypothetical protein SLV14_002867 [Streptomyces sp. Je 1-4]|uniref:hypothetical protein n=1 Tax=Streptomyces TaxID=1883 RepID=UPI00140EAA10|nr:MULTISPECIES: hypothetical protein [unclassified Streptomyces]QIK06868.1 hypothetical protein G7Z12_13220 [Streptomyces sp. ID38640]UYB40266.1 hypothetical protein SLV14_002867 [Streptomyces sp. Je 1-4]UZQ36366.1 hypothetical protein SLV14N_002867 [Streptomyces sp. Je 1-4] [Streptomyces sp. Je 1-4 4N24]UZQ43784.1 hypothetical protein SLV14NA_002867 [Streptomyces sp. Je 1-4] [Streptomyces sp. Je 1-4 4N24_ara]